MTMKTGTITYNIADTYGEVGDAFTLDFGRPAAHTITLLTTDQWDEPAATSTKTSLPPESSGPFEYRS